MTSNTFNIQLDKTWFMHATMTIFLSGAGFLIVTALFQKAKGDEKIHRKHDKKKKELLAEKYRQGLVLGQKSWTTSDTSSSESTRRPKARTRQTYMELLRSTILGLVGRRDEEPKISESIAPIGINANSNKVSSRSERDMPHRRYHESRTMTKSVDGCNKTDDDSSDHTSRSSARRRVTERPSSGRLCARRKQKSPNRIPTHNSCQNIKFSDDVNNHKRDCDEPRQTLQDNLCAQVVNEFPFIVPYLKEGVQTKLFDTCISKTSRHETEKSKILKTDQRRRSKSNSYTRSTRPSHSPASSESSLTHSSRTRNNRPIFRLQSAKQAHSSTSHRTKPTPNKTVQSARPTTPSASFFKLEGQKSNRNENTFGSSIASEWSRNITQNKHQPQGLANGENMPSGELQRGKKHMPVPGVHTNTTFATDQLRQLNNSGECKPPPCNTSTHSILTQHDLDKYRKTCIPGGASPLESITPAARKNEQHYQDKSLSFSLTKESMSQDPNKPSNLPKSQNQPTGSHGLLFSNSRRFLQASPKKDWTKKSTSSRSSVDERETSRLVSISQEVLHLATLQSQSPPVRELRQRQKAPRRSTTASLSAGGACIPASSHGGMMEHGDLHRTCSTSTVNIHNKSTADGYVTNDSVHTSLTQQINSSQSQLLLQAFGRVSEPSGLSQLLNDGQTDRLPGIPTNIYLSDKAQFPMARKGAIKLDTSPALHHHTLAGGAVCEKGSDSDFLMTDLDHLITPETLPVHDSLSPLEFEFASPNRRHTSPDHLPGRHGSLDRPRQTYAEFKKRGKTISIQNQDKPGVSFTGLPIEATKKRLTEKSQAKKKKSKPIICDTKGRRIKPIVSISSERPLPKAEGHPVGLDVEKTSTKTQNTKIPTYKTKITRTCNIESGTVAGPFNGENCISSSNKEGKNQVLAIKTRSTIHNNISASSNAINIEDNDASKKKTFRTRIKTPTIVMRNGKKIAVINNGEFESKSRCRCLVGKKEKHEISPPRPNTPPILSKNNSNSPTTHVYVPDLDQSMDCISPLEHTDLTSKRSVMGHFDKKSNHILLSDKTNFKESVTSPVYSNLEMVYHGDIGALKTSNQNGVIKQSSVSKTLAPDAQTLEVSAEGETGLQYDHVDCWHDGNTPRNISQDCNRHGKPIVGTSSTPDDPPRNVSICFRTMHKTAKEPHDTETFDTASIDIKFQEAPHDSLGPQKSPLEIVDIKTQVVCAPGISPQHPAVIVKTEAPTSVQENISDSARDTAFSKYGSPPAPGTIYRTPSTSNISAKYVCVPVEPTCSVENGQCGDAGTHTMSLEFTKDDVNMASQLHSSCVDITYTDNKYMVGSDSEVTKHEKLVPCDTTHTSSTVDLTLLTDRPKTVKNVDTTHMAEMKETTETIETVDTSQCMKTSYKTIETSGKIIERSEEIIETSETTIQTMEAIMETSKTTIETLETREMTEVIIETSETTVETSETTVETSETTVETSETTVETSTTDSPRAITELLKTTIETSEAMKEMSETTQTPPRPPVESIFKSCGIYTPDVHEIDNTKLKQNARQITDVAQMSDTIEISDMLQERRSPNTDSCQQMNPISEQAMILRDDCLPTPTLPSGISVSCARGDDTHLKEEDARMYCKTTMGGSYVNIKDKTDSLVRPSDCSSGQIRDTSLVTELGDGATGCTLKEMCVQDTTEHPGTKRVRIKRTKNSRMLENNAISIQTSNEIQNSSLTSDDTVSPKTKRCSQRSSERNKLKLSVTSAREMPFSKPHLTLTNTSRLSDADGIHKNCSLAVKNFRTKKIKARETGDDFQMSQDKPSKKSKSNSKNSRSDTTTSVSSVTCKPPVCKSHSTNITSGSKHTKHNTHTITNTATSHPKLPIETKSFHSQSTIVRSSSKSFKTNRPTTHGLPATQNVNIKFPDDKSATNTSYRLLNSNTIAPDILQKTPRSIDKNRNSNSDNFTMSKTSNKNSTKLLKRTKSKTRINSHHICTDPKMIKYEDIRPSTKRFLVVDRNSDTRLKKGTPATTNSSVKLIDFSQGKHNSKNPLSTIRSTSLTCAKPPHKKKTKFIIDSDSKLKKSRSGIESPSRPTQASIGQITNHTNDNYNIMSVVVQDDNEKIKCNENGYQKEEVLEEVYRDSCDIDGLSECCKVTTECCNVTTECCDVTTECCNVTTTIDRDCTVQPQDRGHDELQPCTDSHTAPREPTNSMSATFRNKRDKTRETFTLDISKKSERISESKSDSTLMSVSKGKINQHYKTTCCSQMEGIFSTATISINSKQVMPFHSESTTITATFDTTTTSPMISLNNSNIDRKTLNRRKSWSVSHHHQVVEKSMHNK